MNNTKYSAGTVSKQFWFNEFKMYVELLNNGLNREEIKTKQVEENIFKMVSKDLSNKVVNECKKKSLNLDNTLLVEFNDFNFEEQRLLSFLGMYKYESLLFEYVFTILSNEKNTFDDKFDTNTIKTFLDDKIETSSKVANFSPVTIKRLYGSFLTFLKESCIIIFDNGEYRFNKFYYNDEIYNYLDDFQKKIYEMVVI